MTAGVENLTTKRKTQKDDRITIKIDKDLWKAITQRVKDHPEWGVRSVSDFIRRAVANELEEKRSAQEKKVIEISLHPRFSREGNRDRGP